MPHLSWILGPNSRVVRCLEPLGYPPEAFRFQSFSPSMLPSGSVHARLPWTCPQGRKYPNIGCWFGASLLAGNCEMVTVVLG